MRHQKTGRKFGPTSHQTKHIIKNIDNTLIHTEYIKTTVPKAKELRGVFEPLVTLAKVDSVANRRRAFSKLRNDSAVGKLFSDLGPRFKDRPGGYLRIIKMGPRPGDAAPMAFVELTDKSEDSSEEISQED